MWSLQNVHVGSEQPAGGEVQDALIHGEGRQPQHTSCLKPVVQISTPSIEEKKSTV